MPARKVRHRKRVPGIIDEYIMKGNGLYIRLLGTLEVRCGNRTLPLPRSKKTRALLGYLVATERLHSRQVLCDLLYESSADPRSGLRWSLSKLRSLLENDGAARVVALRDRTGFEPHGATVDLAVVRKLAAPDPKKAATEKLAKAAALFRGEFLEGLDLPPCYGFETWRTTEREAAHRLHETILRVLIDRLRDQPEKALPYARDRLLGDPLSEEAHIDFVRVLAAMGRKEEALEQYERCRHMLETEFNARPSAEMEALRRSLSGVRATEPHPQAPYGLPRRLDPASWKRTTRHDALSRCFVRAWPAQLLSLDENPSLK